MPLPDSIYMTRYRKRHNQLVPYISSDSGVYQSPRSVRWDTLDLIEETWDHENSWFDWLDTIRHYRKIDKAYARQLRMLDVGSPFYNRKVTIDMGAKYFDLINQSPSTVFYHTYGPLVAAISTNSALNAVLASTRLEPSNELSLDAAGTTAIARCAPASPHASAYTAVGELYRDGLPSIPGLTTLKEGDIGGEYLNYAFGIQPTISDIKQLTSALYNAKTLYEQYRRDAGRLVRRGYTFPVEKEVVNTTTSSGVLPAGGAGYANSYFWPTVGETVHTITDTTERWFSGAFTYAHLQDDNLIEKMGTQIRRAQNTLGVLPTPEAIWNLAPWSWAADWVTNIGDVLHNISMYQTDGLMMRFGYIMEHKTRVHDYVHRGSVARTSSGLQPVNLHQRIVVETKRRRPATPFGFGVELDGLSGRQKAIIAALLFSRGKNRLISM